LGDGHPVAQFDAWRNGQQVRVAAADNGNPARQERGVDKPFAGLGGGQDEGGHEKHGSLEKANEGAAMVHEMI
jgi:hypothetical protein